MEKELKIGEPFSEKSETRECYMIRSSVCDSPLSWDGKGECIAFEEDHSNCRKPFTLISFGPEQKMSLQNVNYYGMELVYKMVLKKVANEKHAATKDIADKWDDLYPRLLATAKINEIITIHKTNSDASEFGEELYSEDIEIEEFSEEEEERRLSWFLVQSSVCDSPLSWEHGAECVARKDDHSRCEPSWSMFSLDPDEASDENAIYYGMELVYKLVLEHVTNKKYAATKNIVARWNHLYSKLRATCDINETVTLHYSDYDASEIGQDFYAENLDIPQSKSCR